MIFVWILWSRDSSAWTKGDCVCSVFLLILNFILEEGKATHSSILAWRVTWTEEPGGLQSLQLQRVEHDWVTNIFIFTSHDINPHTSPMRWASFQLYRWRPSDSKTWNRGPGVTQLVRGIMGVESLSSWFQYLAVNPYILLWVYHIKPWTRY